MKIIVYHSEYGCESGCCGHTVECDGTGGRFEFDHPGHFVGRDYVEETPREFAERLVRERFGEEHVKDLDWENCVVSND